MHSPTFAQRTLAGLAAAALLAAAPFPVLAQGLAPLQIIDAGALREFVPADDEVFLHWPGGAAPGNPRAAVESRIAGSTVVETIGSRALVKMSRRIDAAQLRDGTDDFSTAFPGVQVMPVLYQSGFAAGKSTRRVITRRLLAGVAEGRTAAQVGALVGAVSARASGAEGIAILEVASPHRVLEAVATLEQAGIPANPMLGHTWDTFAPPADQFFNDQWHLFNTGQSGSLAGIDANVLDAWQTTLGAGITIGIVDSCLQTAHPDLFENTPLVSSGLHFDFLDEDPDPNPHFGDRHGTSVAGVAAARQNNGNLDPVNQTLLGVSGAAPEARLIGLRLINEAGFVPVTDVEEATALFWKAGPNVEPIIDVSNNSWGPNTAGAGLVGPDILTRTALRDSVLLGRDRKGQVTLFAAGNGRQSGSESNLSGYQNSRYVITVGAIDNSGKQSFYSESGTNLLVSAPSNGGTLGIVTADNINTEGYNPPFGAILELSNTDYTNQFGGTSSATPLVAGVAALVLGANPALGWRDVKEILASTARQVDPADAGWFNTPALPAHPFNRGGFKFNRKYGGGIVDASAAVVRALEWANLGQEREQIVTLPANQFPKNVPDSANNPLNIDFLFSGASYPNLRVETIEVTLDITHDRRSDLEISLVSPGPNPTTSILVAGGSPLGDNKNYRYAVFNGAGGITKQTTGWTFTTSHHWGEDSAGTWRVVVRDRVSGTPLGKVLSATVRIYGTQSSNQRFTFEKARHTVLEPDNAPGALPRELLVRVLRLGPPVGTATIAFASSSKGTATPDALGAPNPDYLPLNAILTFGNGETFKDIPVAVLHDDTPESTESVYLFLKDPTVATLGGTTVATIDLIDNDENSVSVQNTDPTATEPSEGNPPDHGTFTISRTAPSNVPLVVRYTVAGTATPGLGTDGDYLPIEFVATIPANETSTTVTIVPRDDERIEGTETVELTLSTDPGYKVGIPRSSIVRIIDDDRPQVQVSTVQNSVLLEGDQARIATVRVSRTDDTSLPLDVNLAYGGNQMNGSQYQDADAPAIQANKSLPALVTIPAGQSSVDLHIRTVDDAVYQALKTITVGLDEVPSAEFTFGFLRSTTLNVIENDPVPDTRIPTVRLTGPRAGTRFVLPAAVAVAGSAADNETVQAIEYRLNSGTWKVAPGVTPAASVTFNFNLKLPNDPAPDLIFGANVMEVRSIDNDGNRSPTGVLRFTYVEERDITLSITGGGVLTRGFVGTTRREVGKLFTITATPQSGQVFNGWVGLKSGTGFPNPRSRTITFGIDDLVGPTLGAEFIASPYVPAIVGTYSGLARQAGFAYDSSGFLTVQVTPTGAFTASLLLGGKTHAFRGELGGSGRFTGTVPRAGNLPLEVDLQIDLAPAGTQRITGTITSPTFNLIVQADRSAFSRTTPAPTTVGGRQFTLLLPSNDPLTNGEFEPDGNGFGTVTIGTDGVVRVSGALPDGTRFALVRALTKDLTWPFFLEPYSRTGVCIGIVTHNPALPETDFAGSFGWFKPARSRDRYFQLGFQIAQNDILGSLYARPASGRALGGFVDAPLPNARIAIDQGNLATPIDKAANFTTANIVTVDEANSISVGGAVVLRIDPRLGTFSGSFTHPVAGRRASFSGVLFQKQDMAAGGFNGISIPGVRLQTGRVILEPR